MPWPDLSSAATFILPTADVALRPSEKNTLFHEKHITQTPSAGSHHLVVFPLRFGLALIILLASASVALFIGNVKLLSAKKKKKPKEEERENAPRTLRIDLFLEDAVFFCLVFDQMCINPGTQPCWSDITLAPQA